MWAKIEEKLKNFEAKLFGNGDATRELADVQRTFQVEIDALRSRVNALESKPSAPASVPVHVLQAPAQPAQAQ